MLRAPTLNEPHAHRNPNPLYDQVACVAELVRLGADLEAVDDRNRTALHVASTAGSVGAARSLLALGANPRARAGRDHVASFTPLMFAALNGHLEVVHMLLAIEGLDHSQDVDGGGRTALDLARAARDGRRRRHTGAIYYILSKNPSVQALFGE